MKYLEVEVRLSKMHGYISDLKERLNLRDKRIAELEKALGDLTNTISSFAGIEAWVSDVELKEKWQSKIYPAIEKAKQLLP